MSYMYYSMLGTIVTIVVAMIVSYITKSSDDVFDESLLHPIVLKIRNIFTCQTSNRQSINEIERANMNLAFVHDENIIPAGDVDKVEFSHAKSTKSTLDLKGIHVDIWWIIIFDFILLFYSINVIRVRFKKRRQNEKDFQCLKTKYWMSCCWSKVLLLAKNTANNEYLRYYA